MLCLQNCECKKITFYFERVYSSMIDQNFHLMVNMHNSGVQYGVEKFLFEP